MKTGMDFRGLIWKRVWKMTFLFVWNRARIWRTGRHTPTKNFHESPREPLPVAHLLFLLFKISIMVKQNHQWVPSSSHPPGRRGGRKTPSCYCWTGKVRICLNCVAGVKRGKGLEGSGGAEGWVIWYHGISRGLNWNRQNASILCKDLRNHNTLMKL